MYAFLGETPWLIHSAVKMRSVIPVPEQVWGLEEMVEQETVRPTRTWKTPHKKSLNMH